VVHVVVLSDTHMRPGSTRRLPPAALDHLGRADVILHAGDIVAGNVVEELAAFAPVHAVLGNNDVDLVGELPETLVLDLDGVRIAMVHDSGQAAGRARRLRRRFPDADVVVFGHSHIPWNEPGEANQAGTTQLLLNPGSPTDKRRQPRHTLATLDLDGGRVVGAAIHPL
jgi:putative phosphoesterase